MIATVATAAAATIQSHLPPRDRLRDLLESSGSVIVVTGKGSVGRTEATASS